MVDSIPAGLVGLPVRGVCHGPGNVSMVHLTIDAGEVAIEQERARVYACVCTCVGARERARVPREGKRWTRAPAGG